jgi:preprotein translocase subunit SecE
MKDYLSLIIWIVIIGGAFAYAWYKGYWLKISNFIDETREELKKCTWPSWEELKGSTVVIFVVTFLLGLFIVIADLTFLLIVRILLMA